MRLRLEFLFLCGLSFAAALFSPNLLSAQEQGLPSESAAQPDPDVPASGNEIILKNAEIATIVRIYSKRTGRNYILDERVKGRVSIYIPGKVNDDEAIRILDSVLALKGFSTVPISENLWKIVPAKEAKQTTIPTLLEDPSATPSAMMVTRILNLKYLGAEDAKGLLTPLISGDGLINAYSGTNSLIIIDSHDNIQRLVSLVESIDVPFTDREMTIIPVNNAEAADIAQKLSEILGIGSGTQSGASASSSDGGRAMDLIRSRLSRTNPPAGAVPANKPGASTAETAPDSQAQGGTARSREPKIIADERTNSLIVVADEDTTARIRALVSQLDSERDLSGRRFYVYRCKYASADELAQVLSGMGGSSGTGSGSGSLSSLFGAVSDQTGSRSLSGRNRSSNSRTQDRLFGQQRTPGRSRSESRSGSGPSGAVSLSEDVSITADPATNALIINATKNEYQKLLELLKDLDIKRRQVLVEAMLLEVAVDKTVAVSTDFLSSAGGLDGGVVARSDFDNNLTSLFADPTKLSNFSVAAASAGTLKLPGGITLPTQAVLLSAAQSNSNVNVLSAPTILATDNEQAEIVVGQNVPFLASTSTSETNLNNTFNQIDRQDVGITLRLTPQLSGEDTVRLQIFTEVSNVVAATLNSTLGPTTTVRTSETSVIARDGQMVVTGGLMADDVSESEAGVPFLKDVPVLGHLFRSQSEAHRRTNLLIFITPRVVRDQFDARDTTRTKSSEMEQNMKATDSYPPRQEILRNEDIDNVIEASSVREKSAGTILPTGRSASGDKAPGAASSSQSPVELRVSPRLPEAADLNNAHYNGGAAPAAAGRLVALELHKGQDVPSGLPFSLPHKAQLLLVSIPPESSPLSFGFFQAGAEYTYSLHGDRARALRFKALGIFGAETEAREFLQNRSFGSYTLSPYEILNLGNGPWNRG